VSRRKAWNPPVPRHVDEADELAAVTRANPAETMSLDLRLPVVLEQPMVERLGMKRVELRVVEITAPLIRDLHAQDFRA
jgi:hypothetical protein